MITKKITANLTYLILMCVMVVLLSGCRDVYNRTISVVYNGHGVPVTVYNDSLQPIAQLESRSEIIVKNSASFKEGFVHILVPKTNTTGWIPENMIHKITIVEEKKHAGTSTQTFERLPTFEQELEAAGSTLSASIFDRVEELHFSKHDYSTTTWAIIMIVCTLLGFCFLSIGTGNGTYLLMLIGVLIFALAFFAAFVIFCIQEPFEDGAHTGWGWFADLLVFIGLLVSGFYLLQQFSTITAAIIPYTVSSSPEISVAGFNFWAQKILIIIYALSLWLFKGAADWILWAIIIIQGIFSLYVIVKSFMCGFFIQPILYVVLFPFFFVTLLATILTLGTMVFIIVLLIVGVISLLTQPNSSTGEIVGVKVTDGMGITLWEDRWK